VQDTIYHIDIIVGGRSKYVMNYLLTLVQFIKSSNNYVLLFTLNQPN